MGLRVAAAASILLIAACAPVPTRVREATPAAEAAQAAREAALAPRSHWMIAAHIGVSSERDSGSGDLDWRQNGDAYAFTMHAPITGKTWKLQGDVGGATLEGVESRPIADGDVQRLLRERIGWDVPLASLRAWVFGLRAADSPARIAYDDQNLPSLLEQGAWKVEYREWFAPHQFPATDFALPKRVFASNGTTRVKLAIYDWSLGE